MMREHFEITPLSREERGVISFRDAKGRRRRHFSPAGAAEASCTAPGRGQAVQFLDPRRWARKE